MKKEVMQEAIENQSKMEEEEYLLTHDIGKIKVAVQHSINERSEIKNQATDEESELIRFADINAVNLLEPDHYGNEDQLDQNNNLTVNPKFNTNDQFQNNSSHFVNDHLFGKHANFVPYEKERPFQSDDLDFGEMEAEPISIAELPAQQIFIQNQQLPPVSENKKSVFERPESRTILSQGPYILHETKRDSISMPNLEAVEAKNLVESVNYRNTGSRRRSRPLPLVHNSGQQNSNTLPAAIALSKETNYGFIHGRQHSVPYDYQHHNSEQRNYFRSPSVPVEPTNAVNSHYRQSSTMNNNTTTIHDSWV
jgi:hypothetical protein